MPFFSLNIAGKINGQKQTSKWPEDPKKCSLFKNNNRLLSRNLSNTDLKTSRQPRKA